MILNNFLKKINTNFYCFYRLNWIDSESFSLSVNISPNEMEVNCISDILVNLNYDNIVMTVRSSDDVYSVDVPTLDIQSLLISNISKFKHKNLIIFKQNPWPEPLPIFSNNILILKIGYDEGSDLDKFIANGEGIFTDSTLIGTNSVLLNKNGIFPISTT